MKEQIEAILDQNIYSKKDLYIFKHKDFIYITKDNVTKYRDYNYCYRLPFKGKFEKDIHLILKSELIKKKQKCYPINILKLFSKYLKTDLVN